MASNPPPPRYKVIERDRRLITIDTWSGGIAGTAQPPRPTTNRVGPAPAVVPAPIAVPPAPGPASLGVTRPLESADPAQPGALPAPLSGLPDTVTADGGRSYLHELALTLCGGRTDEQGRPLLKSGRWIDGKAPRTIALMPAAADRLGGAVLGLIVAAIAMIALLTSGTTPFSIAIVALVVMLVQGKAVATRFLDRLEALSR